MGRHAQVMRAHVEQPERRRRDAVATARMVGTQGVLEEDVNDDAQRHAGRAQLRRPADRGGDRRAYQRGRIAQRIVKRPPQVELDGAVEQQRPEAGVAPEMIRARRRLFRVLLQDQLPHHLAADLLAQLFSIDGGRGPFLK